MDSGSCFVCHESGLLRESLCLAHWLYSCAPGLGRDERRTLLAALHRPEVVAAIMADALDVAVELAAQ
jgi:hypothetical protein